MAKRTHATRNRERPLGAAIGWAVGAVILLTLLELIVLLAYPTSAFHVYYLIMSNRIGLTPGGDLWMQLTNSMSRTQFVLDIVNLAFGGMVIGRLAPRRDKTSRIVVTASLLALAMELLAVGSQWFQALATITKGVRPSIDRELALMQTLAILLACGGAALGSWIGIKLRDRKQTPNPQPPATIGARLPQ